MTVEDIAVICHEANKAYCERIGDFSQSSWEDAESWQRKSAKRGVVMHLDNPEALPEDSHNSWLKEKREDGWKYGPIKNAEKKEHPCFVEYDKLPEDQQIKDYIFSSIVKTLTKFIKE